MFREKIPKIFILNIGLILLAILFFLFPTLFSNLKNLSVLFSKKPLSGFEQLSAIRIQNSFRNVYRSAKDSIVSIRTKNSDIISSPYQFENSNNELYSSLGSGFIIDTNGFIVTNYHVIKSAKYIEVITSNGEILPAKFVGSHERADIALIKIANNPKIKPISLGDSSEIEVGDWAIAIGSPFGLEKSFTVGIISAKSREDIDETGQSHIQTDNMINPGSSGGPLLNIYGEVIGINRLIRTESGRNSGIAFAIPINYARKVIKLIIKNVGKNIRPATLGVLATIPIEAHRKILEIPPSWNGVLIYDIKQKSSAFQGGLKKYDFILEANDVPIKNINELREQIGLVGLGSKLKLLIFRDKKTKVIDIQLIDEERGN